MSEKKVYLDWNAPIEERVNDLVSRMTVEEKVTQLSYNSKAVPRLGIDEYCWWNEALHGVARCGLATVFPQAIGLASTFDAELVRRVADAISDEARAKYYESQKKGLRGIYRGLTFWTPNINIFRDPRWGRGQETYGEDPYLTSVIGTEFVKGLQGEDPKYLKTAACAKHYAVHSGPEPLRHSFNAIASKKDLWETYLPAFRALVKAGVESVMGAYNRTNGEPCCGSKTLLIDILRAKWGFNGHVVSDCWAIRDFHEHHKITANGMESAALAIKNGCDLNCGCVYEQFLYLAYKEGLVSEEDIDRAVKNLMRTRFKLGMFDPVDKNPYSKISSSVIRCKKHIELAKEAAVKSIVLLKNKENILPLRKDLTSIYLCGPNATNIDALTGNYNGLADNFVSVLEGIMSKVSPSTMVEYKKACLIKSSDAFMPEWAGGEAANHEAVIFVGGLDSLMEGEEGDAMLADWNGDRLKIELPEPQVDYLRRIKNRSPMSKIILVLIAGSPVIFPDDLVDAVLYVAYPGEQGGNAIADVIFGDRSPAGRLPFTIPKSLSDLPPYEDYNMENRTYRYMKAEPLYPFGFGLSYAKFAYSNFEVRTRKGKNGLLVEASVVVENKSDIPAEEVVQLYLTLPKCSFRNPFYSLKGFKRVNISEGRNKKIVFRLTEDDLKAVNEEGEEILLSGEYKIYVGGSNPHPKNIQLGAPQGISAIFSIS